MGFECCHPAVNLIYFIAVIWGMLAFHNPVFILISFFSAFAYSVKRNGCRAAAFNTALLPLILVFALYYGTFNHFGITVLGENFIGNRITLESFVYGLVLGASAAGAVMWFSCVFSVFSSDKAVYLFGKASPGLSLFLSILLRMVPEIKREAGKIRTARRGIGKKLNYGNAAARLKKIASLCSILITWTIDAMVLASYSMRSRGVMLKGRRAFSVYRFDNRDRAYAVAMSACITITFMGVLLKQTDAVYDPKIIMAPVAPMSYFFYAGYAVLCLMPLGMELFTEYCFCRARSAMMKK